MATSSRAVARPVGAVVLGQAVRRASQLDARRRGSPDRRPVVLPRPPAPKVRARLRRRVSTRPLVRTGYVRLIGASAVRSRRSSTRQKSCWRPSTKVTGISSPKRSRKVAVGVDVDLDVRLAQVGADPLDDLAGVVAEVAAGPGVERDAGLGALTRAARRPASLDPAQPALLDLAGDA